VIFNDQEVSSEEEVTVYNEIIADKQRTMLDEIYDFFDLGALN
jgi:hypothetical protein